MRKWTDVIVPGPEVKFPSLCPTCSSASGLSEVTIRARGTDLECDVVHCAKCARRLKWWIKNRSASLCGMALVGLVGTATLWSVETVGPLILLLATPLVAYLCLSVLDYLQPAIQISSLGNDSLLFRFSSVRYADCFVQMNPPAFTPNGRWRWRLRLHKWLKPVLSFFAMYFVYLAIVLPFTREEYRAVVPLIGLPFALASTYILQQVLVAKRRP